MEMDKRQVPESLGNSMAGYHTRGPTNQHLEIAAKECTRDANKHDLLDQNIKCVHYKDRIGVKDNAPPSFVLEDLNFNIYRERECMEWACPLQGCFC